MFHLLLNTLILFLIILYMNQQNKPTIYFFPVLVVILETIRAIYYPLGKFDGFNSIILFSYILVLIVSKLKLEDIKSLKNIFILYFIMSIYFILQTGYDQVGLFSGLSRVFRFLFVYLFFFIGYKFFKSQLSLSKLNKYTVHSIILFLLIVILLTLFEYGKERSGGIFYGFIQGEIYYFPLFVILSLLIYHLNIKKGLNQINLVYFSIATFGALIFTIISLSRTAWIILLVGLLILTPVLMKERRIRGMGKVILLGMILVSFYVYSSGLYLQRESRFTEDYNPATENRLLETIAIHEVYLNTTTKRIFGTGEAFSTIHLLNNPERSIHSTYNRIYHGFGFLGIFIFLTFNGLIMLKLLFISKNNLIPNSELKLLKLVGLSILMSYMAGAFAGVTLPIAYATVSYLYLGGILGLLNNNDSLFQLIEKSELISGTQSIQTLKKLDHKMRNKTTT